MGVLETVKKRTLFMVLLLASIISAITYWNAVANLTRHRAYSSNPNDLLQRTLLSKVNTLNSAIISPTKNSPKEDDSYTEPTRERKPKRILDLQNILPEQNRVLYKLYKATQDPNYDCLIRVLRYRDARAVHVPEERNYWKRFECSNSLCSIETRFNTDLDEVRGSDVCLMMHGEGNYVHKWDRLLAARAPGQQWVLITKESAVQQPWLAPPMNVTTENPYNLSVTYRYDSDIIANYGIFEYGGVTAPPERWNKTRLITWIASNCNPIGWNRTGLVREIQQYLPVDIYGKCGVPLCDRNDWPTCEKIIRTYKFYLSFENSECDDYISEKLWHNALDYGLVPIVYGGGSRESYEKVLPPNSFIHIEDFDSFEELAEYIRLLDANDVMYESYLEWQRFGKVKWAPGLSDFIDPKHTCDMIDRLVKVALAPEKSWRSRTPNITEWWTGSCQHKTIYGKFT